MEEQSTLWIVRLAALIFIIGCIKPVTQTITLVASASVCRENHEKMTRVIDNELYECRFVNGQWWMIHVVVSANDVPPTPLR